MVMCTNCTEVEEAVEDSDNTDDRRPDKEEDDPEVGVDDTGNTVHETEGRLETDDDDGNCAILRIEYKDGQAGSMKLGLCGEKNGKPVRRSQ